MRTHRLILVLCATAISVLLGTTPAAAGVIVSTDSITGIATIGDSIAPLTGIPDNGLCMPSGKGAHVPGAHGSGKNKSKTIPVVVNKEFYYRLAATTVSMVTDTNDASHAGPYTGVLDVCGIVSPGVGGIGAACGPNSGRNGKGKQEEEWEFDMNIRFRKKVKNVSWPQSAGSVLPVYGHVMRVSADETMQLTAKGTFQGIVQFQGASPCLTPKPGGARTFNIVGVVSSEMMGLAAPQPIKSKPRP
jgi:hypothetical protein